MGGDDADGAHGSPEGAGHGFRDSAILPVVRRCRLSSNVVECRGSYGKSAKTQGGEAVPATRRIDGAWQCGAGIPACQRRRAQTGMSAPHWGLLAPIVPVDTRRHLSIPVGSSGGIEDEEEYRPVSSPVDSDRA